MPLSGHLELMKMTREAQSAGGVPEALRIAELPSLRARGEGLRERGAHLSPAAARPSPFDGEGL